MTLREFFLERFKAERPTFLRVINAVPMDRRDYTPNERSATAEGLIWKLTSELQTCLDAVVDHKGDWGMTAGPSMEEMIERYRRISDELETRVTKMTEDEWMQTAKFYFNGQFVYDQPVGQALWFVLFDAIHHRGQLTTYLRPMGSKVPSIYGPSADEVPAM
jgi:uncharacterized damage-inducible protein DinB